MSAKDRFKELVGNSFFTVRFQTLDGGWRVLTGRLGVKKHLRGGERTASEDAVVVWDCAKRGYRTFFPKRVEWLKCYGMKFEFKPRVRNSAHADNYKARKVA